MKINVTDYPVLKHMATGQSVKVAHPHCSDSKAMSIRMDVKGFLFKCFKCGEAGFLAHENSTFRDRKLREAEKAAFLREKERVGYNLPTDFSHKIGQAGLAWLGLGGWTADLIYKHGIGWSDFLHRVVIRVSPVGYTARAVEDDQVPKYLAKYVQGSFWQSEPITDRVCLTEDILSAGRVGQLYPAMAMLGTDTIHRDILAGCSQVLIWTDNDAAGEKARANIHQFLDWMPDIKCFDIRTARDPKCYTTREIQYYLETGGAYV